MGEGQSSVGGLGVGGRCYCHPSSSCHSVLPDTHGPYHAQVSEWLLTDAKGFLVREVNTNTDKERSQRDRGGWNFGHEKEPNLVTERRWARQSSRGLCRESDTKNFSTWPTAVSVQKKK